MNDYPDNWPEIARRVKDEVTMRINAACQRLANSYSLMSMNSKRQNELEQIRLLKEKLRKLKEAAARRACTGKPV